MSHNTLLSTNALTQEIVEICLDIWNRILSAKISTLQMMFCYISISGGEAMCALVWMSSFNELSLI